MEEYQTETRTTYHTFEGGILEIDIPIDCCRLDSRLEPPLVDSSQLVKAAVKAD